MHLRSKKGTTFAYCAVLAKPKEIKGFKTHRLTLWSSRKESKKTPSKQKRRKIGDNESERRRWRREERRNSIKPFFATQFQAQTCH